jgi:hypothetical protein
MISVIRTKLLIVAIALLASIASYFAYERHERQVEQAKANNLGRPVTASDKQAVHAASTWGSQVNKQQLK